MWTLKISYLSISIILLLQLFTLPLYGQYYYTIESFNDTYTELDTHTSLYEEKGFQYGYTKDFELGFDFPFYDSLYANMYWTSGSACSFGNSTEFNLYLLSFSIYELDRRNDSIISTSDIVYGNTEVNGLKAFVIQFNKVRLYTDTSIAEYDSYLDFQTWLFENGDIEIRFGERNLDNSPNYIPGEGFYQIFEGFDPTLNGPYVGIQHASDPDRVIGIEGPYDSFSTVNDIGILNTLPPEGWVIRFNREFFNSSVEGKEEPNITVYPNPTSDYISFVSMNPIGKVVVYNQSGEYMYAQYNYSTKQLDLSHLTPGIYLLKIFQDKSIIVKKVIKK